MFKHILFIFLFFISIGGASAGSTWQSDTGIVSGLGDVGASSTPTVFYKDSTWYLISGESTGIFNGYNWTGSTWQSDTGIVSGLGDIGVDSTPTIFEKDSIWYLISGEDDGVFYGYNWTGSTWQSDTGIVSGLPDIGDCSTPTVFQKDSTWYLITGEHEGIFNGYNWTGSTWQSDTEIVSGLPDIGSYSTPTVFQKDSTWYLISGESDGVFNGYWTGSTWVSDPEIVFGLVDVGYYSTPTVFQKDSTWYLISGEGDGVFNGFRILPQWLNANRDYRQKIIVSHINASGADLINYPAFLNITKDDDMQADYDDLIFYDADGNLMDAELEKGYGTYALVWINITTLETTDTFFYMYYGNTTCSDSWDMHGVWNADYVMVQHLQESPANGTAGHIDSTSNNNNGTPQNFDSVAGSTTDAEGVIDGADEFDGTDDYVNCGNDVSLNITKSITITGWIYIDMFPTIGAITFKQADPNVKEGYNFDIRTDSKIHFFIPDGSNWNGIDADITTGKWHYVCGIYDQINSYIYIDGKVKASNPYTHDLIGNTGQLGIGGRPTGSIWSFDGNISDITISNTGKTSDWIKQDYETVVNQSDIVMFGSEEIPPYTNVSLYSVYPDVIYTNYTGSISVKYIVDSNYPLNLSSLAALFGVNYTLDGGDMHSYLKVPSNSIASEGIYRAHNRNKTPYMAWESNDTITDGNVWQWAGGDITDFWITNETINDTHTWINVSGIASNVFPSMFYLDRDSMYSTPKTRYEINQHQGIIFKMFDLEGFRGRNNDYYVSLYFDTLLESTTPTESIQLWYCNNSFDPLSDDPTICACCVKMDEWSSARWMDHEAWQPHSNVSYVKPLQVYAGEHPGIPPDEVVYIYLASDTVTSKSYMLNTTNYDPGICNITYAQTQTMWLYNELLDVSTPLAYTPSFYATFVRDYEEFVYQLFVANDQDVWGWSGISNTSIGLSNINPTHCVYNYYWWNSTTDYYMNGTYNENFWVNLTYGYDPDNEATLTHVLSLYDNDYNFEGFINDSLIGNATDVDIFFDMTDYNNGYHRFKIVSTDNENSTSVTWSKLFEIDKPHPFLSGAYLFYDEMTSGLTDFKNDMGKYLVWVIIFFAVSIAFALMTAIKQTLIGGK